MVIAEMAELGAFVGPGAMEIARPHSLPFFVRGPGRPGGRGRGPRGAARAADPRQPADQRRPRARDRPPARRHRSAAGRSRRDAGRRLPHRLRRAPRRAERLPDVRQRQGLGPADGGLDRKRPRRRGRGREGAVGHPHPHVAASPTPTFASGCTTSTTSRTASCACSPAPQPQASRELPEDAILVARNIGPGELLDYGRRLKGVVLEEGSVGSHAAIVARALAIPLVIHAERITREAQNGDHILVDGDQGAVHLRPEETVAKAFREKIEMLAEAQQAYAALRDKPATTRDGVTVPLHMNAGLMADLPSLPKCGAVGVGLFRTELQFLIRATVPKRADLAALYARILDSARREAGSVPHPRHRLGQGASLHEAQRGAEPGARLAGDPGRARPAGHHAHAGAGAAARLARAGRCRSCSPSSPRPRNSSAARELVLRRVRPRAALGHVMPASLESARCSRHPASPSRPTASSSGSTSSRSAATT